MLNHTIPEQLDYLVIGHLSCDRTPTGNRMGGTAAYSALTSAALGLRTGLITAVGDEISLEPLSKISISGITAEASTTFENIATPDGRIQKIYHVAPSLSPYQVPNAWRQTPIVHFGPIANEIDLDMLRLFPSSFVGVTPQGWMRAWNKEGVVKPSYWLEYSFVLEKADAAVISQEDVRSFPELIEEMALIVPVLAVTQAARGVDLYFDGEKTHVAAPGVGEVDAVGAGDVFASVFFYHLHRTQEPIAAAQIANFLAAQSVTRRGLESIPTEEEVYLSLQAVI